MRTVERIDMGTGSTQADDASESPQGPTASWGDQGQPMPRYDTGIALLPPGIPSTVIMSGNQQSAASARACLERYNYLSLQYYTPQADDPPWDDLGVTPERRVLQTYRRALRAYADHFR